MVSGLEPVVITTSQRIPGSKLQHRRSPST
jgi:hypothetical protein